MTAKKEVRDFLVAHRARISHEELGITSFGERRVPGLRREEVAALAGVSLDYYIRLERGNIRGASESVLRAVGRALRLTPAEQMHLSDLARNAAAESIAPARHVGSGSVRSSVQSVLDNMSIPAVVHNASQDIVATNRMGRALYSPLFERHEAPNFGRFVFLDPSAREFYVDWAEARRTLAAMLRFEIGRDPLNTHVATVIHELSNSNTAFREDWGRQDVHLHTTGVKAFRHPQVGILTVSFDVFEMPNEPGLMLVAYSPPPRTQTANKFSQLSSWIGGDRLEPDPAATPQPS